MRPVNALSGFSSKRGAASLGGGAGDRYVAVLSNGRVLYSPDLVNWRLTTLTVLGIAQTSVQVAARPVKVSPSRIFLTASAGASSGPFISDDEGLTYQELPITTNWPSGAASLRTQLSVASITRFNGVLVAFFDSNSGRLFSSANGGSYWSISVPERLNQRPNRLATNLRGLYQVWGFGGVAESNNAINWARTGVSGNANPSNVVFGNGIYVSLFTISGNGALYSSTDMLSYTLRYTGAAPDFFAYLVFGNGIFLVFSASAGNYLRSVDGINWTYLSFPAHPQGGAMSGHTVVFDGEKFVAGELSRNPWRMRTSADGLSWTVFDVPVLNSRWPGISVL